jgi:hypothetical protein
MQLFNALIQKSQDFSSRAPVTIACLGDSVTHGCFEVFYKIDEQLECTFDYESVYHAQLKRKFAMLLPSVPVNIINAGISGDSATGGLARLERDVLRFAPDLVTVCFGLNDVCSGLEAIGSYESSLTGIFRALNARGMETIFITPNMMNTYIDSSVPAGALRAIAERCSVLQTTGAMDAYMDCARAVCARENIPVCDCYRTWRTLADAGVDTTALLANHINHPTREMHAIFADALFAMLIPDKCDK